MNCKKCNAPLVSGDQFCKNCGAAVNEVNAQPMAGAPVQPMAGAPAQPMSTPAQPMAGGPVAGGFQQPAFNQPMQPQQPVNAQPKKNTTLFIIIGIVVVALIAAGVILYINLGKKDNNTSTNNSSSNSGNATTTNNKENNGSTTGTSGNSGQSGTTTVGNSSYYTVKLDGFTLEVPTNLIYEVSDGAVILYDEDETWASYIAVIQGNYSSMVQNKTYYQSYYQSQGYTVGTVEEKTIGGSQYFVMELSQNGENILLGVTKANSMYAFIVTLFTIDNEFDYTTLGSIDSILSNAKYTGDSSSISSSEKVDLGKIISGFAQ